MARFRRQRRVHPLDTEQLPADVDLKLSFSNLRHLYVEDGLVVYAAENERGAYLIQDERPLASDGTEPIVRVLRFQSIWERDEYAGWPAKASIWGSVP